ncbi:MAG: hypothetical protein M3Y87_25945 [Myxococcota bacterium]|nr:hypothetical protein [Myxococcota bacterium]
MTARRSSSLSSSPRRPRGGCITAAVVGLVSVGIGVMLTMTLLQQCGAASDALDAYVASIRRGADVSAEIGGDDAAALTQVLRSASSVAIDDLQGQWGTACYGTRIERAGGSTAARFLLEERADGMQVVGASLRRECVCPDPDLQQPCRLE